MSKEEKEEFYRQIYERTHQLRVQCLFEEPCPLYEDDDDFNGMARTY